MLISRAMFDACVRHMHCSFSRAVGNRKLIWLAAAGRRGQLELEVVVMANDDRDILELLKDELDFIEKGGYGRSVRTPWLQKSTFQDSLTCINYGYPYRAHPCNECHLLDFVSPEHHGAEVPCHFIPLNEAGETIEDLEAEDNEAKLERKVRDWLRARIKDVEEERALQALAGCP
jgi:hypothetical protein